MTAPAPAYAFTPRALYHADACDFERRFDDLAVALGRAPGYFEPIPLTVWWGLPSTSTEDRILSLRLLGPEALFAIRAFARACADRADGHAARTAVNAVTWADVRAAHAAVLVAAAAAHAAAHAEAAAIASEAAIAAHDAAVAATEAAEAAGFDAKERAAQRADLDRLFLGVSP